MPIAICEAQLDRLKWFQIHEVTYSVEIHSYAVIFW